MRQISASSTFDSTHRDEREGLHLHGHTYRVTVTELGTDAGVKYDLHPDLRAVLDELDRKSLDDMLTGGSQTLDGIASWVMERLLGRHPRLVRVDISFDPDIVVSVTREIR